MPERFGGVNPSERESLPTGAEEYKKQLEAMQEKLGRFKRGQIVNVKRSSGKIESEWFISGYNDEKDKVVVMQNVQDPTETALQIFVSMEDLETWNPE